MSVSYFGHVGLLADCIELNRDDNVKPQGGVSNIIVPDLHENSHLNSNIEFTTSVESFMLKNITMLMILMFTLIE